MNNLFNTELIKCKVCNVGFLRRTKPYSRTRRLAKIGARPFNVVTCSRNCSKVLTYHRREYDTN